MSQQRGKVLRVVLIQRSVLRQAEAPGKLENLPDGRYVFGLIGRSQMIVTPLSPPKSMQINYGMFDRSFDSNVKSAGIHFNVYGANAKGDGRIVWSTFLNPATVEADRGFKTSSFDLPSDTAIIVLETSPDTPGPANAAYWGGIEFH